MSIRDITGQRYGRLVAVKRTADKDKWGKCYLWECRCDCGAVCLHGTDQLQYGAVRSCGCLQKESRMRDATGERYGRLVALAFTGRILDKSAVWTFKCDCGSVIEARLESVRYSGKHSCGCLLHEHRMKLPTLLQTYITRENGTNINSLRSDSIFRNNTTGYRGVTWNIRAQKYAARIMFKGESYHLGYFDDPQAASDSYQAARERLHKAYLAEREPPTP